jgi:protein MPE1
MASSVFFRFRSQKEPTRVTFDGTGISVFELKREIINMSKLGDGSDFELILSSDDGNEGNEEQDLNPWFSMMLTSRKEYDDDTTIIPRSTTVIAKRLPAVRPGRGGAARYVSGQMPVSAKNAHRSETATGAGAGGGQEHTSGSDVARVANLQSEEERTAAVLKMGAEQWEKQQQKMARYASHGSPPFFFPPEAHTFFVTSIDSTDHIPSAVPVHRGGPNKSKPANVPDRELPPGYVCHRCGEKGLDVPPFVFLPSC